VHVGVLAIPKLANYDLFLDFSFHDSAGSGDSDSALDNDVLRTPDRQEGFEAVVLF
jgi:hypothetical protein